ncbi:MAG: hypothetical protein PHO08_03660 [Methylococcales bacterium]|nr:hypothetical protein [Methylococcales bacterium]
MSPYQNHATMQGHITHGQASDLTQAAYCKENGIKPHIFSYYKNVSGNFPHVDKLSSLI